MRAPGEVLNKTADMTFDFDGNPIIIQKQYKLPPLRENREVVKQNLRKTFYSNRMHYAAPDKPPSVN